MTLLERIAEIAKNENISIGKLEQRIGASKGVLSRALANNSDIQSKWVINLVENYPQYSLNWLISGNGPMLKETTQLATPQIEEKFPLRTDRVVELQSVPLYELDAAAGLVSLFDDSIRQVPINHLQIPDLPPCSGAIYVRGDSMYPILKSGDIVCYKEVSIDYNNIIWGEMYLLSFNIDGENYISIKYIQKSEIEGMVCLVSHNPYHSPKDIPASSITALALVKASVRFNTMG
ncbi:MAG: S24 family peptidase [Candidatus Cryptobacteroides sp.]